MSFSFDKFLRPITPTDRNIKIYEDNGILKYTINPFHIKNINVLNNTMRINLDSDRSIAMVFSTNNEAKISLSKLQGQLDTLQQKVPFIIDKDILNYVTAHIKIGPTGSNGRIFTGTSSTHLTIPNSGNLVQLTTQKDLAFVPGQTIVVYKDFPTNYYVADYLDEPYYDYSNPVYMIGDVDTYDSTTGNLAFVANICQPTGATSSFWYINLTGQRGQDGTSGTSGASAYQTWLNNGKPGNQGTGTELDFLATLKGEQGIQGLGGNDGNNGTSGTSGTSGASAYQIWLNNGAPGNQGTYSESSFLLSLQGEQGIQGLEGQRGPTGSILPGNGLILNGYTMSVGGTLYETLNLKGGYNDFLVSGFDNISVTSSVFDVVSDFISLDSNDSSQILSINDVTISAGGELALTGNSGLVSIGNTQGLVYQSDYSTGFVANSLVSKKYVDSVAGGNTTLWIVSESPELVGNLAVSGGSTMSVVDINVVDAKGLNQTAMLTSISGLVLSGLPVIFSITDGSAAVSLRLETVTSGVDRYLLSGANIHTETLNGPATYSVSYTVAGNSGSSGVAGVKGATGTNGLSVTTLEVISGSPVISGNSVLFSGGSLEYVRSVDSYDSTTTGVVFSIRFTNYFLAGQYGSSFGVSNENGVWKHYGDFGYDSNNSIYGNLYANGGADSVGTTYFSVGDMFMIYVDGTTVYFYKNSTLLGSKTTVLQSYKAMLGTPLVYSLDKVLLYATGKSGTSGTSGTSGVSISGVDSAATLRWTLLDVLLTNPTGAGIFSSGYNANLINTQYFKFAYNSSTVASEGFFDTISNSIGSGNSVYLQITQVGNPGITALYKISTVSYTDPGNGGQYEVATIGTPSIYGNGMWNYGSQYTVSFLIAGNNGNNGNNGTSGTSGITPTTDWSLSGSLTVSGTSSLTGHTILSETSEVLNVTPGATASTVIYDFNTGAIWYHATASTNYTANFKNMPTDNNRAITATIMISQGNTGYMPTSLQIDGTSKTIKWAGGTYSVSTNKVDIIGFTFVRAGSDWAQVLGQISSFG
jgi:hypothetical protein